MKENTKKTAQEKAAEEGCPVPLNLDGVYCREERNGKWFDRCFSDLTEEEQEKFLDRLDTAAQRRLCRLLAACLRTCSEEKEKGDTGDVSAV